MNAYPSMPTPISGISPAVSAEPIVTKPTSLTGRPPLAFRRSFVPGPLELGERQQRRGLEIGPADERQRLGRPELAFHRRVLPLDGQGPGILDPVERPDHRVEVDIAAARRHEVPAAVAFPELQV